MSIWKRITCHPELEQRMKQYYDEKGLADVRIYFAQWIEEKIISEQINRSGSSSVTSEIYEELALQFFEALKQKIINVSDDNVIKYKLPAICSQVIQTPPIELYSYFRNGLQKELQLLEQMPQNMNMFPGAGINGEQMYSGMPSVVNTMNPAAAAAGFGIAPIGFSPTGMGVVGMNNGGAGGIGATMLPDTSELYVLLNNLSTVELKKLSYEISTFNQEYGRLHQNFPAMGNSDQRVRELVQARDAITITKRKIFQEYCSIQNRVINELKRWQRNQALAGNGAPSQDNLDSIQYFIEELVKIIMFMIQLESSCEVLKDPQLLENMEFAKKELVLSAFIVDKQPPQVMKTNTRFAASVRWLVGPSLGINMSSPIRVHCHILSEGQAQRHWSQRDGKSGIPHQSGEIQNNEALMEFQPSQGVGPSDRATGLSASFRNMQLKKIKRAEKKGTESVMDEKFALLFYTTCTDSAFEINVWTLSLPVVVIVHGNQEPQSWATITWDNAFAEVSREPFIVPSSVPWRQLSEALDMKFKSATGRGLTQDNIEFLHEKLFHREGPSGSMIASGQEDCVSWTQFCKEPLTGRNFTFWDWFFAIIKLTKDHLLGLWKKNLVVGFISKKRAQDTLHYESPGTFILRFSDSELGGTTIAFRNQKGEVMSLAPWTARDLQVRGAADRIRDLDTLQFIYPIKASKDEVLNEFYSQNADEQTTRDGYVASTIRAHVPAVEMDVQSTPHHQMQSPNPQMNDIADFDLMF